MIPNQWYAILPSTAVTNNGIVTVKRLNLEFALFRTAQGKLGCVVDQCTHRGAALSGGKVVGDCVQCPFHALKFNPLGKCVFVPANGKASTEDLTRFNVKSYLVREAHGIIYLWYGEPDKATNDLPYFEDHLDESYVFSEMEDHWNTHYSRAIENQLDVVHVPIVHYNTIGRGNKTLINGPKVLWENGVLTTSANNEVDNGQKPKKPDECVIKPTFLSFKYPNVWLNHISPKIKVMIYFAPVDDENTILYIRFYNKITPMRAVNHFIAWVGRYFNGIVERQDKVIVITQKPKASNLRSGERLVIGDGPIVMYRRIREELQKKQ